MNNLFKLEGNHTVKEKKLRYTLPIAGLVSLVITIVINSGILSEENLRVSDQLYQREKQLESDVFLIGIDEEALEYFGPTPWTRDVMAEAIQTLNVSEDCHPAVIGVDVMYFGYTDEIYDNALVDAMAEYGNVVTTAHVTYENQVIENTNGELYIDSGGIKTLELPYPEITEVAEIGHINPAVSADGIVRHALTNIDMPELIEQQTGVSSIDSFPHVIYKKYHEYHGLDATAKPPVESNGSWYLSYSAKSGGYSDGYSVSDLITGELSPELFADKIVLIGPYATGLLDQYKTSIDGTVDTYGVEIFANIIDALIENEYRVEVSSIVGGIIMFLILFLLFFPFFYSGIGLSTTLMIIGTSLYLLLARWLVFPPVQSWFLFDVNDCAIRYMLDPLYIPLGIFIMYFGTLIINLILAHKQKKQVTDIFKKYVDPAIVNDLFEVGMDNLELGGKNADICVMFVDIRGFTTMSEILTPREVVSMLGEYLEITSSAVFKFRGTVDKFIGDATMAFWNAPVPQEDYIYHGVLAAWDLTKRGLAAEQALKEKYGRSIGFGVGINCGEAVVGNIGTMKRMDYTAIGDTVNTAARLESNAKAGQILMSEKVYEAVKDRVTAVHAGEFYFKGKAEAVSVYALEMIHEYAGIDEPLKTAKLKPGK